MEEDIKKIESFIAIMKSDFRKGLYYKDELEAIEHLLKAYKELKYKYNKALGDLVQAEHKNKELEEKQESYNTAYNSGKAFENHRWRSLIKEKIEELNKEDENLMYKNNIIKILQELLERRK